jgi:hypothetical protein
MILIVHFFELNIFMDIDFLSVKLINVPFDNEIGRKLGLFNFDMFCYRIIKLLLQCFQHISVELRCRLNGQ